MVRPVSIGQRAWKWIRRRPAAAGLAAVSSLGAALLLTILLISHMQTMPKPVLIHCKSGADRTGLAAALYLLVIEGQPIEVAKRQLSFRYIHVSYTATGILDHFLRVYEDAFRDSGIGFLEWMRTAYDPAELTASFARWRAGDRSLR